MEHSIKVHLNPMSNKKQFIKKSAKTHLSFINRPNLSFITRPNSSFVGKANLSATKTSNRLSLDKNYQTLQKINFEKLNTQRKWTNKQNNSIISHNQSFQESKYSNGITRNKIQKQRRQSLTENQNMSRKRMSIYSKHRQKLKQILQFIDINNSLIQQIIEHDKQIEYYKKQIVLNQRKNASFNLQKGGIKYIQ